MFSNPGMPDRYHYSVFVCATSRKVHGSDAIVKQNLCECVCVYVCMAMCVNIHVEVRG